MRWLRKSTLDPLSVSMVGAKLGDRVLVAGASDPKLIAVLGAKTGLTGLTCALDENDSAVAEAARVALREGALIETSVAPYTSLPFDPESFDIVVLRDVLRTLEHGHRMSVIHEAHRVLRAGGRCLVIESTARVGLAALMGRSGASEDYAASGEPLNGLKDAGFVAVRTLAERDGVTFVEAVKRNT